MANYMKTQLKNHYNKMYDSNASMNARMRALGYVRRADDERLVYWLQRGVPVYRSKQGDVVSIDKYEQLFKYHQNRGTLDKFVSRGWQQILPKKK